MSLNKVGSAGGLELKSRLTNNNIKGVRKNRARDWEEEFLSSDKIQSCSTLITLNQSSSKS